MRTCRGLTAAEHPQRRANHHVMHGISLSAVGFFTMDPDDQSPSFELRLSRYGVVLARTDHGSGLRFFLRYNFWHSMACLRLDTSSSAHCGERKDHT